MQRCKKVNNTTIWWPKKTNETNRFKVKTKERFDLAILKVNQIHYNKIEVFLIRFNSKSIATSSSNLLTRPHANSEFKNSSFWIYTNKSCLDCDFEISFKGFRSPSVMILMQQLCSTKYLIEVLALVNSCVIKRYKTSQISQRVTHKSSLITLKRG